MLIKAIIILLRNTTWKCGEIERLALHYLQRQFHSHGRTKVPIKEMLRHFNLRGKRKSEFIDTVKRL